MSNTEKTKEEHMVDYIKTLSAIETAMEPFKDQRRDLREDYYETGRLPKEEMRLAVKAYRFMKQDLDLDEMKNIISRLKLKGVRSE